MKDEIYFFTRPYYMLSNFAAFVVEWRGLPWPTSEHAYQAAKFDDANLREKIRLAHSPQEAYDIAHSNEKKVREVWNDEKVSIMEEIVRAKLMQHPLIQKKLLEMSNQPIVEDSPTDSFWGWGSNKNGKNHLGKIWMKLRKELQTE